LRQSTSRQGYCLVVSTTIGIFLSIRGEYLVEYNFLRDAIQGGAIQGKPVTDAQQFEYLYHVANLMPPRDPSIRRQE